MKRRRRGRDGDTRTLMCIGDGHWLSPLLSFRLPGENASGHDDNGDDHGVISVVRTQAAMLPSCRCVHALFLFLIRR